MNYGCNTLLFIISHVMHCTAFITYSVAIVVHANRIQSAQNRFTFCANTHDGIHAIPAEGILSVCVWMLPNGNIVNVMAYIAFFHYDL